MRLSRPALGPMAILLLLGLGCLSPERAEKSADKTAAELSLAAWEKAVGTTNVFGIANFGDPVAPLVPDTNGIVRLSLEDALRIGAKSNRRFRTLKETVFTRALALDSEEYAFSTTFSGMILGALTGDPEIIKESARAGGLSAGVRGARRCDQKPSGPGRRQGRSGGCRTSGEDQGGRTPRRPHGRGWRDL